MTWKSSTSLLLTVAFSCFSDRSWSFVVPVVLSRTCLQQSTFFSSVYSFVELLFVIVFTSPIALSLSHRPRMTSYILSIVCQNVLTAFACGILVALVLLFLNSSLLLLFLYHLIIVSLLFCSLLFSQGLNMTANMTVEKIMSLIWVLRDCVSLEVLHQFFHRVQKFCWQKICFFMLSKKRQKKNL